MPWGKTLYAAIIAPLTAGYNVAGFAGRTEMRRRQVKPAFLAPLLTFAATTFAATYGIGLSSRPLHPQYGGQQTPRPGHAMRPRHPTRGLRPRRRPDHRPNY